MDDKIKILFVGDPHFKIKNVEYIPLFTSRIVSIVESNKLDFVVVAGDLLDNHDRIDVEPLNLAINFVDALRKIIKTFVLVGNHDYKNNQQFLSDHHWMNALKKWDNVTIVDDIVDFMVNKTKFLFVPYVPPGRFVEAIETKIPIKNINDFKVVFAHQEFYGCKMGPIESKCGDKWDEKWSMVVSGHIHNKQWSQSNIYYPGSAMQHAFGQSTENTVSILTCHEDELDYEEVDLKMPKLTIKYLTVNDAMDLWCFQTANKPDVKGVQQPLKFKNKEFRKYKIVLQGTQEEFKTFKKNLRYKQLLEEGFKITFKLKNIDHINQDLCNLKKKFTDILYEKVKNEHDSDLEDIFKKMVTIV